jgi:acetyl esterase/lipase
LILNDAGLASTRDRRRLFEADRAGPYTISLQLCSPRPASSQKDFLPMKIARYGLLLAMFLIASPLAVVAQVAAPPAAPQTPTPEERERLAREAREAALKKFADTVDVRLDQSYAGNTNPKQMVDVYLPKQRLDDKPLPVVVFIHGGGWTGGDRKGYVQQALNMASTGKYACVAVGYRLSNEAKWPQQIYDCKAAIRYIHGHAKEWNIDPNKIGVTGTSAGGHLVSLLGVSNGVKELEGAIGDFTSLPSNVSCVINFCGPTDMAAPLMQGEAAKQPDPAVSGLLGGPPSEKAAEAKAASPLTYVSKNSVPIMTVHGTQDMRVDYKHAEKLDAALKQAGAVSLLVPMMNAGHGIPTGPELQSRMAAFWAKYLRGEAVEVATTPIEVPPAEPKK